MLRALRIPALAILCGLTFSSASQSAEWYVAPDGNDQAAGTAEAPLATLTAARQAVRDWRATGAGNEDAIVHLRGGEYLLREPLLLTAEDCGHDGSWTLWQSFAGETATLRGDQANPPASLLAVYDAQNLRVEGIHFSTAIEHAIEVAHCENVHVVRCQVEQVAHSGIHLFGGHNCRVEACVLDDCGKLGIRVEAGDRTTLEASQHVITENRIQNCGHHDEPFAAAMHVAGVGVQVLENRIEDCENVGIRIDGNDHQVRGNLLQRVGTATSDVGAIYLGHDFTERGNVIEHNVIRDVGGEDRLNAIGIYLDDFASGTIVRDNTISQAGRGIAVGGGRDNEIRGNRIADCTVGIQLDHRGQTWFAAVLQDPNSFVWTHWNEVAASESLYRERYTNWTDREELMRGNLTGNVVVDNRLQRSGGVAMDRLPDEGQLLVRDNARGDALFVVTWDE